MSMKGKLLIVVVASFAMLSGCGGGGSSLVLNDTGVEPVYSTEGTGGGLWWAYHGDAPAGKGSWTYKVGDRKYEFLFELPWGANISSGSASVINRPGTSSNVYLQLEAVTAGIKDVYEFTEGTVSWSMSADDVLTLQLKGLKNHQVAPELTGTENLADMQVNLPLHSFSSSNGYSYFSKAALVVSPEPGSVAGALGSGTHVVAAGSSFSPQSWDETNNLYLRLRAPGTPGHIITLSISGLAQATSTATYTTTATGLTVGAKDSNSQSATAEAVGGITVSPTGHIEIDGIRITEANGAKYTIRGALQTGNDKVVHMNLLGTP